MLIAARLLLIKSRALLPDLQVDDEEELSSDELKWRLIQYKKFRDISKEIYQIFANKKHTYGREFNWEAFQSFYPPEKVNAEKLAKSFAQLIHKLSRQEKMAESTIAETVSLEERINIIQQNIIEKLKVRFDSILKMANTKLEVIVTFLALLELIKQRVVVVEQTENFEEIVVERKV